MAADITQNKTIDLREQFGAGGNGPAENGCLAGPGIKKAGILAGLSLTLEGEILRVGAACPER